MCAYFFCDSPMIPENVLYVVYTFYGHGNRASKHIKAFLWEGNKLQFDLSSIVFSIKNKVNNSSEIFLFHQHSTAIDSTTLKINLFLALLSYHCIGGFSAKIPFRHKAIRHISIIKAKFEFFLSSYPFLLKNIFLL